MVANPYSPALQGLSSQRAGAKKGLDLIYKAMRQNVSQFGKRLGTLDTQTAKYIANYGKDLQGQLGGYGQTALEDVLATAGLGGPVDEAQQKYLTGLTLDDVGEYQGYGGKVFKGEADYQKSLRGIDKQYAKDLMAAAVRERQARHGELEQNLLDYSAGLRTNQAMFGAQDQLLGFAQGQLQGLSFGGGGTYSVGAARGLSAAEAYIIQRESGGNPTARNKSSGAFGFGQLNPSAGTLQEVAKALGFNPYTTDPNQQLQMFRYYVQKRYGTAEKAAAFWKSHGWY